MVDAAKPNHPIVPHHVPSSRRQVIAQVIVSAVILVSGIAIGGGGTILALRDRIMPPVTTQPPAVGTPDGDRQEADKRAHWIADRWKQEYGLDDERARRAQETLATEFATMDKLQEELRTAEKTHREKFILAMKGILTSEQFTRWEADFRRMVEQMERIDPRRGGRGGPGRPEWRPDRPMDPNERRGDWRGFRGRDGRRGERQPDWKRDPNDPRGDRLRDRFMDPNGRPGGPPDGPPPERPIDAGRGPGGLEGPPGNP